MNCTQQKKFNSGTITKQKEKGHSPRTRTPNIREWKEETKLSQNQRERERGRERIGRTERERGEREGEEREERE